MHRFHQFVRKFGIHVAEFLSMVMEPTLKFKTTQNAHGSDAAVSITFLTRCSKEAKPAFTGEQTHKAVMLEGLTRAGDRQYLIMEDP